LRTLGYYNEIQPLPWSRRSQLVGIADSMPVWPEKGSIKIIDDTVLIKFGPYTDDSKLSILQRSDVCTLLQDANLARRYEKYLIFPDTCK
jgi:hypothetical protein